jgi:hypothetical protein
MADEFNPLIERFIVLEGDEEKECLMPHGGIQNMNRVKAELATLHKSIMQAYRSNHACKDHLKKLYERVAATYDAQIINDLCGELVKDAMETFHQVATDPKTERMTALYALGYACQLGRDPNLLQMDDPSPYVDMMMDTVNACDATGRKELRKKAQRMRNGLVYCKDLAPYLTGFFVENSEMVYAASDCDPTKDDVRVRAFCHWADVTHDIQGRDRMISDISDKYTDLCREIASCLCEEKVPIDMIVQKTVYQSILKPYANAA